MTMLWSITIGDLINALILLGTAYVVWLYTKAAQRSNEIQEQPVVNLLLIENDNGVNKWWTLKVKNVGRAPAYSVVFSSLSAREYTYHPFVRHESNPMLEPGKELELHFWVHKAPNITEVYEKVLGFRWFLQRFFPSNTSPAEREMKKRTAAVFVINYESINGKTYHSIFRIYSKMWPLLDVYDLVSELISTGEGKHSILQAKRLCEQKPTLPKFQTE